MVCVIVFWVELVKFCFLLFVNVLVFEVEGVVFVWVIWFVLDFG